MSSSSLTGVCSECGGHIQFQAEQIGTVGTCPRCRKQTEWLLASLWANGLIRTLFISGV